MPVATDSFTEFSIIDVFRDCCAGSRADVLLGIGDDAAVTRLPEGRELVVAADALVEGTHFLPGTAAASVGHRCLAVNLSDLAAMGATPHWATLSLAVPDADEAWVRAFADGFAGLAECHGVSLIGGDTVHGPLAVTVTVMGSMPAGEAVTRSGARPGDRLYLSGAAGRAAAGRRLLSGELPASVTGADEYLRRFSYPEPRVDLGIALAPLVTAMIDVSDGVHTDLGRLLAASSAGAAAEIPELDELERDFGDELACQLFLGGGEDYELCFSAAAGAASDIEALAQAHKIALEPIGTITETQKLCWQYRGRTVDYDGSGFEHFGA